MYRRIQRSFLSWSGWTILLARLSKPSWFFLLMSRLSILSFQASPCSYWLGWIDKIAEPVFYLNEGVWMNRGEVGRCSRLWQPCGCVSSMERGQWGNQCMWSREFVQMPRKKLETGDCQTVEKLDCLIDVFLIYYRPCRKPLLVLEKRNFVISLVSMQGQIAAETRNSEILQVYSGFLCGGTKWTLTQLNML